MKPKNIENIDELSPEFLLTAYSHGYFPMAESSTGEIHWYSPDPRAIIELDALKISRSLRQVLNQGTYTIKVDSDFSRVIRLCAQREETWISERIIEAYERLHSLGFAHSIEAWFSRELVGGLYGVASHGAFFGESMFHTRRDASKVALVGLVDRLRAHGYTLLDTQFMTPHLRSIGAIEIPKEEYLLRLQSALKKKCSFFNGGSVSNEQLTIER
jgi:leucyl/phenylalanyl-tRNA--protein transferase